MPTLTRDHLTTYAEPDVDLTETVKSPTVAQANDFMRAMVRKIGVGFHPDMSMTSYVSHVGRPVFTAAQAASLQSRLDAAYDALVQAGEDPYEAAYDEQQSLIADLTETVLVADLVLITEVPE